MMVLWVVEAELEQKFKSRWRVRALNSSQRMAEVPECVFESPHGENLENESISG
jgi:hypothetical protein